MTKANLIEALARHDWVFEMTPSGALSWEDAPEDEKQRYRQRAELVVPLIVEAVGMFVATECRKDISAEQCARRWREAMTETA